MNSCSLASLKPVSIGENSFVYAADGSVLGSIPPSRTASRSRSTRCRPPRPGHRAIEDKRFYSHSGVDYEGIIRAAVKNLQEGEIVQGGSTLTQQLVRNLYIGRDVSWERKTKEACLAPKLEDEGLPKLWGRPAGLTPEEAKRWRKDRILETYLNQVYFGAHAYGAEAAAQTYSRSTPPISTSEEAALIAGLPQAPSIFDPFQSPSRPWPAERRGPRAGWTTSASRPTRRPSRSRSRWTGARSTRGSASRSSSATSASADRRVRGDGVRSGGLKVYTTINPRYQRIAIDSMKTVLNQRGDPASAVVSINPDNGAIGR